MDYRRVFPVSSSIYRPLNTRRFLVMTMGGYWPVLHKLPDGRLGIVTRDGDFHIGERGRLVWVTSSDGGESWSHPSVISADGPDNRNPAFGVAADGTLLACFIKADVYTDGRWDPPKGRGQDILMYLSRSTDGGESWSPGVMIDGQCHERWSAATACGPEDPNRYWSAFGKMITLPNGTILMTYAIDQLEAPHGSASFLIRSMDNGQTWMETVTLAEGYGEPALIHVGDNRLLIMLRMIAHPFGLWQIDSTDGGYTWSEPRAITGLKEHPGDVIRLQDGRLLLTYGRREPPYGIQGMVSHDEGKTWDHDHVLMLAGDSGDEDCGYPSSIQRDDGTIVTVYYANSYLGDHTQRPARRLGIHAAALLYDPKDLP